MQYITIFTILFCCGVSIAAFSVSIQQYIHIRQQIRGREETQKYMLQQLCLLKKDMKQYSDKDGK